MRLVFREYELYATDATTVNAPADGRRLVYTDTLQI
jgi:hypothetical protein